MRKMVLLAFGLLLLPALASAQQVVENCPSCTLSFYAETALNANCGTVAAFTPTDIYLGLNLTGVETGITGIEFSVAGILVADGFVSATLTAITDVNPTMLGDPKAPADTSATSTQNGGMNIAWPSCQAGTHVALAKLTLVSLGATPDKVIKVLHKFPPSNPNYGISGPVITRCDAPNFTAVKVSGGYFVVNPGATPPFPCVLAVSPQTWSALKNLYR
jgi:hypothetical protein